MTCIVDTASINLSVAAGQLSADLSVDPGAGLPPNPLIVNAAGVYVVGSDGWIPLPSTLAFSSADGHTFVATTSADLRSFIGAGDKIRIVQAGVPAYFFVTAIAVGTITLYGGLNYVLAAAAVTLPYFSKSRSPVGFNLDPTAWMETTRDAVDRSAAAATQNVWFNPGGVALAVPIGIWRLGYKVVAQTSSGTTHTRVTLSTANNSESDADFTGDMFTGSATQTETTIVPGEKPVPLAAKTTYFLNIQTQEVGTPTLTFRGASAAPTLIRARCAYL